MRMVRTMICRASCVDLCETRWRRRWYGDRDLLLLPPDLERRIVAFYVHHVRLFAFRMHRVRLKVGCWFKPTRAHAVTEMCHSGDACGRPLESKDKPETIRGLY